MGRKRFNPKRAKIHRNYTVEEISRLYEVHKNTVLQWIKRGLPVIDKKRPMLVLGKDLAAFLQKQRTQSKHKCKPGEIYCVKCRKPSMPLGNMADYQVINAQLGNLVGICPHCEILIYRRVSKAKLNEVSGNLEISLPEELQHIDSCDKPTLNSDFKV